MLSQADLRAIAHDRLEDADVLLNAGRFDGSVYLCGYAVEMALKARICRTLNWTGFPETAQEFKGLQSVKTHDLEVLLRFTGFEDRIKTGHGREWSIVSGWNPEQRYLRSQYSTSEATDMLAAAATLTRVL